MTDVRARKRGIVTALALALVIMGVVPAFSDEPWMPEFEAICGRTQESGAMTPDEIREILARADKLKTVIEGSQSAGKGIYLRRLEKCRKLFEFVLQSTDH